MVERWMNSGWALVLAPGAFLVAAVLTLALDSESGIRALLRVSAGVDADRVRVVALEDERAVLLRQVRQLRADPRALEAAARERFDMVRSGEVVIHWHEVAARD